MKIKMATNRGLMVRICGIHSASINIIMTLHRHPRVGPAVVRHVRLVQDNEHVIVCACMALIDIYD